MIKTLILHNIVLIEEAEVHFKPGLTVVTGETGAGKTALIEAIRLILGERADGSKVRKGCEKSLIQASFDISPSPALNALFDQAGLNFPIEEELIISREINSSGKSRAFVCGQMVTANFLQKLAPHLVDFIGQHAAIYLKNSDHQRELLDRFAEIDLQPFQNLWGAEKELELKMAALKKKKQSSEAQKALLTDQLNELLEADVKEGEERQLFEEYSLLANAQELLVSSHQVFTKIEEIIEKNIEILPLLETIIKYSPDLKETQEMAHSAHLQLSDISSQMEQLQARLESDPNRLAFLEERLKQLDQLKKKYGENLFSKQEAIQKELTSIEDLDDTITSTTKQLTQAQKQTKSACQNLSKQRRESAANLEKLLSNILQELNIPSAEVKIAVASAPRSKFGEDSVTFFLRANLGEKPVSIKESCSGGELARLLFSLKLVLAQKSTFGTMVFDEIDANVGGETATIIGEKLKSLGEIRQVLCITHFPQVARQADQHLRVYKEESGNRTLCRINSIENDAKELELLRMLGGQAVAKI